MTQGAEPNYDQYRFDAAMSEDARNRTLGLTTV